MPPPARVAGPLRSVEGWVLFVYGIPPEAQEEDVLQKFGQLGGKITKIVLNLDRKTGQAKGYALVEFAEREEAQDAINALHGTRLLGKQIGVTWTFCNNTRNFS
jgi:RNA-binding protein 8A